MAAKKIGKNSTKRNWVKIKAEYCTTEISIRGLAKKYDIPYSTINSRAVKERWIETKNVKLEEIKQEVMQQTIEKYKDREIERKVQANENHTRVYDKGLEVAERLLDRYLEDLRDGKKRTPANAYNLEYLMKAISNIQKGQRVSLDINKDSTTTETEPEVRIIEGISESDI